MNHAKLLVCTGCGTSTFNLDDLAAKHKASGHLSCCPDRNFVPTVNIPMRLADQITFVKVGSHLLIPEALRTDHPYCWQWVGRENRNGYGRIRWEGKEPVVHRLMWALLRGEVDRRILLDHRCRNRLCCNPNHLDPVDNRTNTLRGEAVLFKKREDYV